jgi:hypothetical protein
MKKKGFTFLAALLIAVSIFGQSPEKISYQAVVRDATNATVANQVVGMQISILQDGTLENPGSAVYVETQTPTTNANGLLSIYIGAGSAVTGTFSGIAWSNVPHYIKIEIDPSGNNTNYTITGTTQLVSVPFALYAKTAGSSLMPTMTNAERLAISDPATALMVYVTDFDGGTIMLYDGSKWKELSTIQLRTLPDAPTLVTATATNGEATVSFIAPSNNGGSPITKYTATSSPGNITGTLNQSGGGTITVTDLANGTAYTFTVTATNAIDTSAASAASTSVTPATVPDAPTDVAATATNGEATVSFTAPLSDGGSAITSYTATSSPDDITGTLNQSGSGAILVTGLTNGTAYTFTVRATNAVDTSAASAASTSVTPVTISNAPTSVYATAGNTQATVSFTAPSNDGGSAIISYTATSSPGGFTETLNQSGSGVMTVTGLTNGEAYTFTVTATSAVGTSAASGSSTSVTPATTPDVPTDVSAIAGNTQAIVSFTAPSSDGGSVITLYTATSSPGNITGTLNPAEGGAILVTGLTNGTAYTFTVTATNAIGTSDASGSSTSVTLATVPGAPTGVSATATNGEATVSFTAPLSDGGSVITLYTATSSPGNITGTLNPAEGGAITVTDLANGTAYTFTVTATNAIGTSDASGSSTSVTPATVPDAPTDVAAIAGNTQATVSFIAPSNDGGSAITSYTATSSPGNIIGTLNQAGGGIIVVSGLTNGTSYTFSVTATNAIGTSISSAISNSDTQPIAIGDTLEGGIVFYLDGSGGGKVCAAIDQSAGIKWALPAYQTSVPSPGAASSTNGAANTDAIIAQTGQAAANTYAAGLCRTYDGGGFNDWYLPATNELDLMRDNLHASGLGGFSSSAWYWTSREFSNTHGYFQSFSSGNIAGVNKNTSTLRVRAVRIFLGTETRPDSPTLVTATATNGEATVSFTAPSNDGGSAITSYTATSNPGNITGILTQSEGGAITVIGLTNGVAYTFTVTATNGIDTSVASAVSNSVTIISPAAVGDIRAGGVVFWVDPADNTHGLVCALQDYQSTVAWGCYNRDLPNVPNVAWNSGNPVGPGAEIGDGEFNTNGILAHCSSAAAALAARSYGPEWFLPSVNELNEMFINKTTLEAVVGFSAFSSNYYWSSTEYGFNYAWDQKFANGLQGSIGKNSSNRVRAVRAF